MTPEQLRVVLEEFTRVNVPGGYVYVISGLISFVAGLLGAWGGAYLAERAKRSVVKAQFETILQEVRRTTQTTEEVKTQLAGGLWLEQRRWDHKKDCYVEIVKNLGEVHTLIGDALSLEEDFPKEFVKRIGQADDAFRKMQQFGSAARIAVAPSARTVLSRFSDEWNRAPTPGDRGIVARWGWLVITDIARNDLFGEPREMSDEFTGDVEVPRP